MEELLILCDYFYHANHIPLYVYQSEKCVAAFPPQSDSCNPDQDYKELRRDASVFLCTVTPDNLYMGYIPVERLNAVVMIGPVSALPYSPERLGQMMSRIGIPPKDRESARRLYQSVPNETQVEFVDILLFFQLAATGKRISRDDFFRHQSEENPDMARGSFMHEQLYSEVELTERHRDQEVLRYIESGDSDAVFKYLCNSPAPPPVSFGTTPLAYQKHLCYYSVGLFSGAAQRGGLPPLECMEIAAAYYKDISSAHTVEKVDQITGHAALFYAARVASARLPSDMNPVLLDCIHYIRQNIHNRIQVSDIAAQIGYSATHMERLFRQGLGMGPARFILQTRLEEAKSLLRHTDKSLSEISSALCFYDQSHFQRCFKAAYQMTPMEYRQKKL